MKTKITISLLALILSSSTSLALTKSECLSYKEQLIEASQTKAPLLPKATKIPQQAKEITVKEITSSDGKSMPYVFLEKGEFKKEDKRPLFICLHGGGQNPKAKSAHSWPVNTREFQVQISFAVKHYTESGLYFIPRMVDDRLGRWKHGYNIEIFERVIRDAVQKHNADPNRIYLMGISQGAYGIYVLAPFMADSLAAANPMTCADDKGHFKNLRNIAFRTDIGELDITYGRITCARNAHAQLEKLKEKNPSDFNHFLGEQKGKGHSINYFLGQSWIAKFKRNSRPQRISWVAQETFTRYRPRFYWIGLPEKPANKKQAWNIEAEINKKNNSISIQFSSLGFKSKDEEIPAQTIKGQKLQVFLDDQVLDLDKNLSIIVNGKELFKGRVERKIETMQKTFQESGDPAYIFPTLLEFTMQ